MISFAGIMSDRRCIVLLYLGCGYLKQVLWSLRSLQFIGHCDEVFVAAAS